MSTPSRNPRRTQADDDNAVDPANTEPAAPPAPAATPVEDAVERVEVRWISPQTMFLPTEGRIIGYGDTFTSRADRVDVDDRVILATADWTPDPAIVAATTAPTEE